MPTAATESSSAPTTAATETEGQSFQVANLAIQLIIPSDFIILDVSKAKDDSADAYWDEVADRTGMNVAALKSIAAARAGVAVSPAGTTIAVGKATMTKMPSVADIREDLDDKHIRDGKVAAVETGLGKGVRVSLKSGSSFQEFAYVQGPNSVVGVNFHTNEKATAVELFDQVVPTFQGL